MATHTAVALAVVLLVVGLGAGYYFESALPGGGAATSTVTVVVRPTLTSYSTTTYSTSTAPAGPCDQAHPLALVSASFTVEALTAQEPGYLTTTWSDCASRGIVFEVGGLSQGRTFAATLTASAVVYGKATLYTGYIQNSGTLSNNYEPTITSVAAYGTASVSLPIYLDYPYSANAVWQWVAGNATANDPNTGQVISSALYNVTA